MNNSSVSFFTYQEEPLSEYDSLKPWIEETIQDMGKEAGELTLITCSDEELLQINKEHLNHDYYTDIITFDYSEGKIVSGDLFISTDRVKENATAFEVSEQTEFKRVVIHGILHLCGLGDKTEEESKIMREHENKYLERFKI